MFEKGVGIKNIYKLSKGNVWHLYQWVITAVAMWCLKAGEKGQKKKTSSYDTFPRTWEQTAGHKSCNDDPLDIPPLPPPHIFEIKEAKGWSNHWCDCVCTGEQGLGTEGWAGRVASACDTAFPISALWLREGLSCGGQGMGLSLREI